MEQAGAHTVEVDGKRISAKKFIAKCLWELATAGETRLSDGTVLSAPAIGWFEVVKFIYQHIDGPARAEIGMEISGDPQQPIIREEIVRLHLPADEPLVNQ